MASKKMGLVLVLIVAMLWSGAAAQSSTCQTAILTLAACIDYATGKASTPPSGCCSNLASAVSSHPECLCQALSMNTSSAGMAFNQTRIIALPGACNVKTPPFSTCNNATSPARSPAGTPMPTGSGSNTTQGDGSSGASSTKMSVSLLLLLFVASFTMH